MRLQPPSSVPDYVGLSDCCLLAWVPPCSGCAVLLLPVFSSLVIQSQERSLNLISLLVTQLLERSRNLIDIDSRETLFSLILTDMCCVSDFFIISLFARPGCSQACISLSSWLEPFY